MIAYEVFVGLLTGRPPNWIEFTGYASEKRPEWEKGKPTRFLITSPGKICGVLVSYSDVKMGNMNHEITFKFFTKDVKVSEGNLLKIEFRNGGPRAILHS